MKLLDNKPPMTTHTFVIKGDKWWTLSQSMYDDLKETYPLKSIDEELRKAAFWCKTNKRRRKTARGMGKFLNGWIDRADETGLVTDKPTFDRSNQVRQNNVKAYKDQFSLWIAVKSVSEIKGCKTSQSKQFMQLKKQYPELREWALQMRPDLKSNTNPV